MRFIAPDYLLEARLFYLYNPIPSNCRSTYYFFYAVVIPTLLFLLMLLLTYYI